MTALLTRPNAKGQLLLQSDRQLASTSAGVYGALSEKGNYLKYTYSASTNIWTVTDKKGTVYSFGSTAASRLDNPSNASQIYEWKLDTVRDVNNNYIKYTYYKDAGQIYPNTILYTGSGSTDGPLEVDFLRTSRSDARSSARTGFMITSSYLINEVDVKVNGTWVRKYTLGYTTGSNGARSLLNTITEAGQDGQGTVTTLPVTTFSYQQATPGWTATSTSWNLPVPLVDYAYAPSRGDVGTRMADINGDGLPDILKSLTTNGVQSSSAYLNTGNGWTLAPTAWNPPQTFIDYNQMPSSGDVGARIVDLNGDGLPDIAQSLSDLNGTIVQSYVYLNTGSGWALASTTWNPPLPFNSAYGDIGGRIADINGDGLPDLLRAFAGTNPVVFLNTGSGWAQATSTWTPPTAFSDMSFVDLGVRLADVNGDGLPDILKSYSTYDGNHVTYQVSQVFLNTGSGWTLAQNWSVPLSFVDYTVNTGDNSVQLADVNGDGLPDMVKAFGDWGFGVIIASVYLNTGSGWATAPATWNVPLSLGYVGGTDTGVRMIDLEGNNQIDILGSFESGVGYAA